MKQGSPFRKPRRHPDLSSPKDDLDTAANVLESKLALLREEDHDPANPSNWLTPGKRQDIERAKKAWQLPELYVDFLRKFSPLDVYIENRRYRYGLQFYGAHELIEKQRGYAYTDRPSEPIEAWPSHLLVIADSAGDPYVLDLSETSRTNNRVLKARHGSGAWKFKPAYESFLSFLQSLSD